jgi:hypothetical protein
MTTAREIVTQALREGGILALGETLDAASLEEGLQRLNVLVRGTFGSDLGETLTVYNLGLDGLDTSEAIEAAVGEVSGTSFVPLNTLLHLNLEEPTKIWFDPNPVDGARMGIVDLAGNLNTNPLEIDANGKKIEGYSSIVLSTNSLSREWFYRADLGEWVKSSTLLASDNLPFPIEFDDYFITNLALRLNPRYGQAISGELLEVLRRGKSMFRARYSQAKEMASELALQQMSPDWLWNASTTDFTRGRPWNY